MAAIHVAGVRGDPCGSMCCAFRFHMHLYIYTQNGPRKISPPSVCICIYTRIYRMGHEKVGRLPFAYAFIYIQDEPRKNRPPSVCICIYIYRMGHEKVGRIPFAYAFGYCINFCIYVMLRTQATFSWPTLYTLLDSQPVAVNNLK